jgi:ATP-dependent DNA helicase RecQ
MCDICGAAPEWMTSTVAEEKPAKRKKTAAAPAPTSPLPALPPDDVPRRPPAPSPDAELREYMREWRRQTAQRQGVPAYIVLHDSSLEDLCRRRPRSLAELLRISGFGERKAELYGQQIFAALGRFDAGARASAAAEKKISPADETMRLLAEGRSFAEIAQMRDRQLTTVIGLVADLVEKGRLKFDPAWVDEEKQTQIREVCGKLGLQWLKPLREALPPEITFEEIRLVVAHLRREKSL